MQALVLVLDLQAITNQDGTVALKQLLVEVVVAVVVVVRMHLEVLVVVLLPVVVLVQDLDHLAMKEQLVVVVEVEKEDLQVLVKVSEELKVAVADLVVVLLHWLHLNLVDIGTEHVMHSFQIILDLTENYKKFCFEFKKITSIT